MRIPSGKTDQAIFFVAVDSVDRATRKTGLSAFTAYRSRNGAAAVVYTTPTVTELSAANMPGVYSLLIDEDTAIAAGSDSEEYCVHITCSTMAPVTRTIELYRRDTTTGCSISVTAGGHVSNVDTLTTYTGDTPQTGDAYARIGAAGAGLTALGDTRIAHLDADVSSRLASASYTAPLNAAGTRSAVGLAAANLDTQIAALDTDILTRLASSGYTAPDNASVTAIKAQTDKLAFTVANQIDANIQSVNDVLVNGNGSAATPWGP